MMYIFNNIFLYVYFFDIKRERGEGNVEKVGFIDI